MIADLGDILGESLGSAWAVSPFSNLGNLELGGEH